MYILSPENVSYYLKARLGGEAGDFIVSTLGGGVSAHVYQVQTNSENFILKQACEHLRVHTHWQSDPARADREYAFLNSFFPLMGESNLTRPLWHDSTNHILAMSVALPPATPWKKELLEGVAETNRARQAAELLARLHLESIMQPSLLGRLNDREIFRQLRVEPFYDRLAQAFPELGGRILALSESLLSSTMGLCHGDFSPKNLLLHSNGLILVDHETAHLGDCAMDLGFFIAHLTLKAIKAGENRRLFGKLIRTFLATYFDFGGPRDTDFQRRALGHLGVVMLTRVLGTSRVDYLSEPQKEEARQLAIASLQDTFHNWRYYPPASW